MRLRQAELPIRLVWAAGLSIACIAPSAIAFAQAPAPKAPSRDRVEQQLKYRQIRVQLFWDSGKSARWNYGTATIVGSRLHISSRWWDQRFDREFFLSGNEVAALKALIETPHGIRTYTIDRQGCGRYRLTVARRDRPSRGRPLRSVQSDWRAQRPLNWRDPGPLKRHLKALVTRKVGRPIRGLGLGR